MTAFMRSLFLVFATVCALERKADPKYVKTFRKYVDFQKEVLNGDKVWMLVFSIPDCAECKTFEKEYGRVAEVTRGVTGVGVVDVSTEAGKKIGSLYDVDSYPTVLLMGDDKTPVEYTGELKAQVIFNDYLQLLMDTLSQRAEPPDASRNHHSGGIESKVFILTSSNFQKEVLDNPLVYAVAFGSATCNNSKKLRPEWEEAARIVDREGGVFGWVDAGEETELAKQYGVDSYPVIFIFPGGAGKSPSDAIRYRGAKYSSDLVRQVFLEVDKAGINTEIPEVVSLDIVERECHGSDQICILAALPHISETGAERRNYYKDILSEVAHDFRGSHVTFLWYEGPKQPELEKSFNLSFGYPAVVAMSWDTDAYTVMKGPFSKNAITAFATRNGDYRKRSLTDLSETPIILEAEPWDGLDGPPIEEEIPLSDIMGDEL